MAAALLYDLARMTVASAPGLGTITLSSAVQSFLTFAQAGVQNGQVVRYSVRDGVQREVGYGTYTAAGTTLTRNVRKSTNGDALVNLTVDAIVAIVESSEDILSFAKNQTSLFTDPERLIARTNLGIDLTAYAPLASPALSGNPTAPTPTAGDNDTSIANTGFVQGAVAGKVAKAGDTMAGNLVIANSTGHSSLTLQKAPSGNAGVYGQNTGGTNRWIMLLGNDDAEGGGNTGSNFVLYTVNDGGTPALALSINRATAAMTIAGNVSVGGAVALGGQIAFPAAPFSSANPNTLDDYEEGTWTPTFAGVTTPGSHTYANQVGSYVKVGQQVTASFFVGLSAKDASVAGIVWITGLPFVSAAFPRQGCGVADFGGFANPKVYVAVQLQSSQSAMFITFLNAAATDIGYLPASELTNTTWIGGTICYRAAV